MIIRKFTFDGDQMAVYGLIEEINEELQKYGLTLKVDNEVHYGFDVAYLSDDKPEPEKPANCC